MKPLKHLIETSIFVILALIAKPVMAQEIPIETSFSSDTTFKPFRDESGFYSFTMNAGINLLSDSSLVRVVLIDLAFYPLNRSADQIIISLKNYPPGAYFLQLNINGIKKETRKIILAD